MSSDSLSDESSSSSDNDEIESNDENIEQQNAVPSDIELNCLVVGISFHPQKNLLAAGTIEGPIHIYSYDVNGNKEVIVYEHHKKPCRAVQYSLSGEYLFTASLDATIQAIDLETNSVFRKLSSPDGTPIYSLLSINEYLLASGDDNGKVIIWDFRKQSPITCYEENDYVSSLLTDKDKKILVATIADGSLSAYNIKGNKLEMQSELFDYELSSSALVKNETKLVIGAGDGSLNIFNWGEFGNISDRFPGHPGSIEAMVALNDNIICTGCEDGKIRAVNLFPHKFLGVIGTHNGFSVENLILSSDKALLASSSFDQKVKFWDLNALSTITQETVKVQNKNKLINENINDFFSDLA